MPLYVFKFLAIFSTAAVANSNCGTKQFDAIEAMVFTFTKSIRDKCDKGYGSEGVSDVISHALAVRWKEATPLFSQMAKSKKFHDFVISNVDSTCDWTDLQAISENASTRCPINYSVLCKELKKKASEAYAESTEAAAVGAPKNESDSDPCLLVTDIHQGDVVFPTRDVCYINLAAMRKDAKYCDLVDASYMEFPNCFRKVAIANQDIKLCLSIRDKNPEKHSRPYSESLFSSATVGCVTEIAVKEHNSKICKKLRTVHFDHTSEESEVSSCIRDYKKATSRMQIPSENGQ